MEKLQFDGTICLKSKEKICKITVILTQENVFEKIILTPLNKISPDEFAKPLCENPAAKYIENCFYKFSDEYSHLPFAKTYFRKTLFEKLRSVSYGTRISYKEFAKLCGNENAARAVGNALKSNPLPIIYPCHRIVARDGSGGFCGNDKNWVEIKEKFLSAEKNGERILIL